LELKYCWFTGGVYGEASPPAANFEVDADGGSLG
jgi:hypothetical protein